jgi:hypothetical protein
MYTARHRFECSLVALRLKEHARIGHIEGAHWRPDTLEICGLLVVDDVSWANVLSRMRETGELWTWAVSPVWTQGTRAQTGDSTFYYELHATDGADLVTKGGTGGRFLR